MKIFEEWVASVVTVSVLLSLVRMVIPSGSIKNLTSFIGGLIFLLTLLRPLPGIRLEKLIPDVELYRDQIVQRQTELEKIVQSDLARSIEEETEAYISGKARSLGTEVSVQVHVEFAAEGIPLPIEAELYGPYTAELAAYMERELGIPAEGQVWYEKER